MGKSNDKISAALGIIIILNIIYYALQFIKNNFEIDLDFILIVLLFILVVSILIALMNLNNSNPNYGNGNGSNILLKQSVFDQIRQKYYDLAKKHENDGNYKEAARIYFKLLKDNYSAVEALEKGKFYADAAYMHQKYLNNDFKAAECFELAKMYDKAIDLNIKMNNYEKVGDLYRLINQENNAQIYYQKQVDHYKVSNQYVKASFLLKDKLDRFNSAQDILSVGWEKGVDAFNCANNYFNNLKNSPSIEDEIKKFYQLRVNQNNSIEFIDVLKYEFDKHHKLENIIKEIVYEIIAQKANENIDVVSNLNYFNKNNKTIQKDILKFKLRKRRNVT